MARHSVGCSSAACRPTVVPPLLQPSCFNAPTVAAASFRCCALYAACSGCLACEAAPPARSRCRCSEQPS